MLVRSDNADRLVVLGVIGRPHGLGGEVRLHLHNESSTVIEEAATLIVAKPGGIGTERALAGARRHGGVVLLRLAGCQDRTAAEALRGSEVLVPRSALPDLPPDEYYDCDLEGLDVVAEGGARLGEVVSVLHGPAADSLTVRLVDGEYVDIPMVDEFVQEVSLEQRSIVVELPDGLPRRGRP